MNEIESLLGGQAKLVSLVGLSEQRGALIPFHFDQLPFVPRRAFVVKDVPAGTARGRHAHKSARQLLICPSGRVEVLLRSDGKEHTVALTPDSFGLLIEPRVWAQQTYLEAGTILLAFASGHYDPDSYLSQPS